MIAAGTATPMQLTPGQGTLAVLTFLGLAVATALALVITYQAIRGYRGSGNRGLLFLALGIVLLAAVPILVRIVLVNATTVSPELRSVVTTTSELAGLAAILYAIYGLPPEQSGQQTERITVDQPATGPSTGASEADDTDDSHGDRLLLLPLQIVSGTELTAIFLMELLTATVGFFVAYQAYRGYRRNQSPAIRSLGLGILLLTSVPFAISYALELRQSGDATILFVVTLLDVLGLAFVLHALTRQ